MGLHVIVGKGPVGSTTAELLAAEGHTVRVLSRSGGTSTGAIEHRAVDATDAAALAEAARGADALYNCLNPEYHRWATDWPPMAEALLDAAEATGAVLVTMSNVYAYGPLDDPTRPMTEDLPLAATGTKGQVRARMWQDALARHEAGRIRATEARASDFVGPRVTDGGHLGERAVPALLAGKTVRVLGDPDAPHSWTAMADVARALATLGTDERAWGRTWHVPTAPAVSIREAVQGLARAAGVEAPPVKAIPWTVIRAGGLFVPMLRELRETRYQFDQPFVLDSSAFTTTFGIGATPLEQTWRDTIAWWRTRLADEAARPTAGTAGSAGTPAAAA